MNVWHDVSNERITTKKFEALIEMPTRRIRYEYLARHFSRKNFQQEL